MKSVMQGMRVRVIESSPFDEYHIDQELVVEQVDTSDSTLRGRDPQTGKIGGWLHWHQVEQVGGRVGWDFLKTVLSPRTIELLSAFDGLQRLKLKNEVADEILLGVPDFEERIREAVATRRPGQVKMKRRKRPEGRDLVERIFSLGAEPPRPPEPEAAAPPVPEVDLATSAKADEDTASDWLDGEGLELAGIGGHEDVSGHFAHARKEV